ncbi:MAG: single-stranded DNA-binding protein [bacterium]
MATSRSLNRVILIGNLTREPVVRYTPSGSVVCTFGIATNNLWKTQAGEQKEKAEFHNIVAWNKLGEICANILSTGMLVYVEGEIRSRVWESEGQRNYRTEIRIFDMKLLDSKGKSGFGLENAKDPQSGVPTQSESGIAEKSAEPDVTDEEEEKPVAKEDLPF